MLNLAVLLVSPGGQPLEPMERALSALEGAIRQDKHNLFESRWVPDELALIRKELRVFCDQRDVDVLITLGGIGLRPRDRVPEATAEVLERPLPGLAELVRLSGMQKSRQAALSRGLAGMRGKTLIVNLGSGEAAALEGYRALEPLFPYIFEDRANTWV